MAELAPNTLITPSIRLVRVLRRGGMGSVWIADHLTLKTQVIVKFLSASLEEDPANVARFSREAAAAAQVKSPHVVQILDHGLTHTGQPFIVMELLEGKDLDHLLKTRSLAPDEVAHIVEHIARALTRAHERGILHRDIKPANIFLCDVGERQPFVKLVDFGIARSVDEVVSVTTTGDSVGTPSYMSPEQLSGVKLDHRTDLWSLGVVVFRALTGSLPFQADSIGALAVSVLMDPIPSLTSRRPDLPPALDTWLMRACVRDRNHRFSSAREMADALWIAVGLPQNATAPAVSSPSPELPPAVAGAESTAATRPTAVTQPVRLGTHRGWLAISVGSITFLALLYLGLRGLIPSSPPPPLAQSIGPALAIATQPITPFGKAIENTNISGQDPEIPDPPTTSAKAETSQAPLQKPHTPQGPPPKKDEDDIGF